MESLLQKLTIIPLLDDVVGNHRVPVSATGYEVAGEHVVGVGDI